MKVAQLGLPREIDKSFTVFIEKGSFFPVPWHHHPEYEFVLVTKSTGQRMVGDHIDFFEEGDLVLMGPWLPHVWINDKKSLQKNGLAEAVVIHFSETFLGESLFRIPEAEPLRQILNISTRGLVFLGDTKKRITQIMQELKNKNGLQRISELFKIFDILTETNEYSTLASPIFDNQSHTIENKSPAYAIDDYILTHFHNEIFLKDLASHVNMAPTTFHNYFKEHYRMTFSEYLTSIRIGHACKLLSRNEISIADIAYECGYNNLANFNRQFKKIKHQTPTQFQRQICKSL